MMKTTTYRLPIREKHFATLVSLHAPTMSNPEEIKDKLYEDLESVYTELSLHRGKRNLSYSEISPLDDTFGNNIDPYQVIWVLVLKPWRNYRMYERKL